METPLSDTIDYLQLLNRKERFHLLREALGETIFRLDERFRTRLQSCLSGSPRGAVSVPLSVPPDAFVAMDYHLDWIGMALRLAADEPEHARPDRFPLRDIANNGLVSGTQQDVDLLVAFQDGPTTHLVMIEAKGDTHWRNEQLDKKAERLKRIFSGERRWRDSIAPHFVLMSPTHPTSLTKKGWPSWMTPNGELLWLCLSLPDGLIKVTRYDPDGDRRPESYRYLSVDRIKPRTG